MFGRRTTRPSIAPVTAVPGSLAELAGRYRMPHDYFLPDETLILSDRGDHLDARWSDGSLNAIYPVGPNRFIDRNYWTVVTFRRNAAGKVDGFDYRLFQGFVARREGP